MPESTHTLNVNIRGDSSGLRQAVKDSRSALQSFSKTVDSDTGKKTANAFNSAAQGIRNMVKEMQLASGKKVYTDEFVRIQKDVGATTESIKKMEHELGVMEQAGKNVGVSNRFRQAEQQAEALQHRYEQLNAVRNDMTKNPAYSNMERSLEVSNQRLAQLIENNKILKNQGADKELSPQYEKLAAKKSKFEGDIKSAQAEMQRLEKEGEAYRTNDKYTEAQERVNKAREAIKKYREEVENSQFFKNHHTKEELDAALKAEFDNSTYKAMQKELADAEVAFAALAGKEKIATDEMKALQRVERDAGKELAVINSQMSAMEKSGGKFGSKEWQANLNGIEAEKKAQAELNSELVKMRETGTMYLPKDEEEKQQRLESLSGEIEDQKKNISEMQEMRDQLIHQNELGGEEEYQGLIDTLDNIAEKQQGLIDQAVELVKKRDELGRQRSSIQEQRDKDEAELSGYEEEEKAGKLDSSKTKRMVELRGNITDADAQIEDIGVQYSGINSQVNALNSEISNLKEEYDSLIEKKNEFYEGLTENIDNIAEKQQGLIEQALELVKQRDELGKQRTSIQEQRSKDAAELSEYEEEEKAGKLDSSKIQRMAELRGNIADADTELEDIGVQYSSVNSQVNALISEISNLKEEYNSLVEKQNEFLATGNYSQISMAYADLEEKIDEVKSKLEELESSGAAREEIEAAKEELADLERQKASIDSGNGGLAKEEAAKIDEQISATEQRIQDLMSAFETTMNSGTLKDLPIADQLKMVDQAIEHTRSEVEKLDEAMRKMRENGTDQGSDEYVKMIDRREQAVARLRNLQAMSDRLQQSGGDVEDNTGGVAASTAKSKKLSDALRSTKRHGVSAAKSIQDAWKGIHKNFDKATQSIKKTGGAFASLIKKHVGGIPLIGKAFDKGFSGNGLRGISGHISNLTGNILKGTPMLGKFFGTMQSGRGSVTSLIGPLTKGIPIINKFFGATNQGHMSMKKGFMTLIKYAFGVRSLYFLFRRLRSAVKEAFQNIAKEDENTQRSLNDLSASMNMLKNSIGAAFAPILNVVAPILSKFMQMIAEAMNSVGAFFAALTGQSSYYKAVYNLKGVENAQNKNAKSAKNAASANKEMKKTILAFDELNKLEDNTTNSNNGDNGSNFNMAEVPNQFADWANKFKEAWAKADFTKIGKELGDLIGTMLYKIPWAEIESKVAHLAKSLGTFVNGLIQSTKMWQAFGYTAARALNVVMKGYNQFMKQIDFKKYGEDLSQMLKTFKDNFNWMGTDGLGETLAAMPNAMIDTLTGFLNDFTWQDFKDIGSKLGGAINQAIRLTHWEDYFPDLVKLATGILAAINGFLERQPWNEIIPKIKAGMEKISASDWNLLGTQIGDLIKNSLNGVAGILDAFTALLEGLSWSDIFNGVTTSLSQYTGWSTLGKSIGDAVYASLKNSAEILGGFIDVLKTVNWKEIFDSFTGTITENMKTVDWKSIGGKIGDAIGVASDILNGVLEGFTRIISKVDFAAIFDGVKTNLQSKMSQIQDVVTYDENGKEITKRMTGWQKLGHNIGEAISAGLKASGEIVGGFVKVLSSVPWDDVWGEFNESVKRNMSTVEWADVGNAIGDAITIGLKNIGGIASAFASVLQSIEWDEVFSGIKVSINEKMSKAISIKDDRTGWEKLGDDIGNALRQGLKAAIKIVLGATEILMSIDWHGLLTHLADNLFGNKDGELNQKDWDSFANKVKKVLEDKSAQDAIKIIATVSVLKFLFAQTAASLMSMFGTSLAAGLGGTWTGTMITGLSILAAVDLMLDLTTNWNKPDNKGKNLTQEEADKENDSGWKSVIKSAGEGGLLGLKIGGPLGGFLGAIGGAAASLTSQKPGSNKGVYAHAGQDYSPLNVIDPDGKSWIRMSDGRWIKGTNANKDVNVIEAHTWEQAAGLKIPGASGKVGQDPGGSKYDAIAGVHSANDYKGPTYGNEYGLAGAVHLFDNNNTGKTGKTGAASVVAEASTKTGSADTHAGNTLTVDVKPVAGAAQRIWTSLKKDWNDSSKEGVETKAKLQDGIATKAYSTFKNEYTTENKNNPLKATVTTASNAASWLHKQIQSGMNTEGKTNPLKATVTTAANAGSWILKHVQNDMNGKHVTTDVKEKDGAGSKIKTSIQGDLNKEENTLNANVTASEEKKKTLLSSLQTWFNENPIGVTVKKAATNFFGNLFGGNKEKEEQEETVNVKLVATEASISSLRQHIQTYFDGDRNQIYMRLAEKTNASSDLKGIIQNFFDGSGHEIKMWFKDNANANSNLKKIVQDYFSADGHEINTKFTPAAEANATLLSKVQEYFNKKGNELKTYFVVGSGVLGDLKSDIQTHFNKKESEIVTYFKASTYAATNMENSIQNHFNKSGNEITAYFELPSNRYVGSPADLLGTIQEYFNNHTVTVYTETSGSGSTTSNAEGGIFNNGRWQPVTTAANGGTFESAQMFVARERGPELVGTIGNKTAVVNNDQIVASVAAGVFEAVVSANQQSQGSSEPIMNDITIMIDSERAYRVVQKGKKLSERRYGTAFSI